MVDERQTSTVRSRSYSSSNIIPGYILMDIQVAGNLERVTYTVTYCVTFPAARVTSCADTCT